MECGVFPGKAGLICSIGCCYTVPRRHILRHVKREGKAALIGREGMACCDWSRGRTGPVKGAKHSYEGGTSSYLLLCASPTHDINSNRILCSSHCFGTTTKIAKVEVGIQFMGLAVCPFLNLLPYKILRPQFYYDTFRIVIASKIPDIYVISESY